MYLSCEGTALRCTRPYRLAVLGSRCEDVRERKTSGRPHRRCFLHMAESAVVGALRPGEPGRTGAGSAHRVGPRAAALRLLFHRAGGAGFWWAPCRAGRQFDEPGILNQTCAFRVFASSEATTQPPLRLIPRQREATVFIGCQPPGCSGAASSVRPKFGFGPVRLDSNCMVVAPAAIHEARRSELHHFGRPEQAAGTHSRTAIAQLVSSTLIHSLGPNGPL